MFAECIDLLKLLGASSGAVSRESRTLALTRQMCHVIYTVETPYHHSEVQVGGTVMLIISSSTLVHYAELAAGEPNDLRATGFCDTQYVGLYKVNGHAVATYKMISRQ